MAKNRYQTKDNKIKKIDKYSFMIDGEPWYLIEGVSRFIKGESVGNLMESSTAKKNYTEGVVSVPSNDAIKRVAERIDERLSIKSHSRNIAYINLGGKGRKPLIYSEELLNMLYFHYQNKAKLPMLTQVEASYKKNVKSKAEILKYLQENINPNLNGDAFQESLELIATYFYEEKLAIKHTVLEVIKSNREDYIIPLTDHRDTLINNLKSIREIVNSELINDEQKVNEIKILIDLM